MKQIIKIIDGGNESRIRKVTLGLKTPIVTLFPRSELNKYSKEKFASCPGVYILYNEVSAGNQSVYIGEAESIYDRMCQHDKNMGKNFWTNTIVMQDLNISLNKAHYKYLEYMIYTYITTANRVNVINKVIPTKSLLSEDNEIFALEFLEAIREIFRVLNIKILEPKVIGNFEEDKDVYYLNYRGAFAKMRIKDSNDMLVLAGSTGIYPLEKNKEGFDDFYSQIEQMISKKEARLIPETYLVEYLVDLKFDSENEACAFITQENLDGSDMWKTSEGNSLFVKPIKSRRK